MCASAISWLGPGISAACTDVMAFRMCSLIVLSNIDRQLLHFTHRQCARAVFSALDQPKLTHCSFVEHCVDTPSTGV